jgi:hypothetical protein
MVSHLVASVAHVTGAAAGVARSLAACALGAVLHIAASVAYVAGSYTGVVSCVALSVAGFAPQLFKEAAGLALHCSRLAVTAREPYVHCVKVSVHMRKTDAEIKYCALCSSAISCICWQAAVYVGKQ